VELVGRGFDDVDDSGPSASGGRGGGADRLIDAADGTATTDDIEAEDVA
jgi:hypothetical protein